MIRHSPAEVYIKYLVVHPDGYGEEAIVELLRLKQLDFIGTAYVNRIRRDLHPPLPFRPLDKLHRPSVRFLTTHRLHYLFHPDDAMEQALAILENPQTKEVIETMLITHDSPAVISYRMKSLGMACSLTAIERYRFFFFNVDLVDATELRALMRLRTDYVDPNSDDYDDQIRAAMKKVGYRDPRRLVAEHPMRSMASLMNQMRMGFLPSSVEIARLSTSVRVMCMAQAAASAVVGGPRAASEVRDYVIGANGVTELLNNVGRPDSDLQKELQMLALRTDEAAVPYIGELTEGSHTVDVQPLYDREVGDGGE
jgi:hypothetical protein